MAGKFSGALGKKANSAANGDTAPLEESAKDPKCPSAASLKSDKLLKTNKKLASKKTQRGVRNSSETSNNVIILDPNNTVSIFKNRSLSQKVELKLACQTNRKGEPVKFRVFNNSSTNNNVPYGKYDKMKSKGNSNTIGSRKYEMNGSSKRETGKENFGNSISSPYNPISPSNKSPAIKFEKKKKVIGYNFFTNRQKERELDDQAVIKNIPVSIFVGTWNCEYFDFSKDYFDKKGHGVNDTSNNCGKNEVMFSKLKEWHGGRSVTPILYYDPVKYVDNASEEDSEAIYHSDDNNENQTVKNRVLKKLAHSKSLKKKLYPKSKDESETNAEFGIRNYHNMNIKVINENEKEKLNMVESINQSDEKTSNVDFADIVFETNMTPQDSVKKSENETGKKKMDIKETKWLHNIPYTDATKKVENDKDGDEDIDEIQQTEKEETPKTTTNEEKREDDKDKDGGKTTENEKKAEDEKNEENDKKEICEENMENKENKKNEKHENNGENCATEKKILDNIESSCASNEIKKPIEVSADLLQVKKNMMHISKYKDKASFSCWIQPYQDIYVISLQESISDNIIENLSAYLKEVNQETYVYLPLVDYKLSGYGDGAFLQTKSTTIAAWVRKTKLYPNGPVKLCASKSIAFNKLNNSKGCVSVLFNIFNQFVLFIGCHMPATNQEMRQKSREFVLTKLSEYYSNKSTSDFKDVFHHVIWMGDFNFRVKGIKMDQVIECLKTNNIKELLKYDEINKSSSCDFIKSFTELPISFLPTYKKIEGRPALDKKKSNWIEKEYKLIHNIKWYKGGKQEPRIPSWTDRIFKWSGEKINICLNFVPNSYTSATPPEKSILLASDHSPVSCCFYMYKMKNDTDIPKTKNIWKF